MNIVKIKSSFSEEESNSKCTRGHLQVHNTSLVSCLDAGRADSLADSGPYTLYPNDRCAKMRTLHPAPCTLHPAPCTLHPAP